MILDPIHTRPRRPVRAWLGIRINHDGLGSYAVAHRVGDLPRGLARMADTITNGSFA